MLYVFTKSRIVILHGVKIPLKSDGSFFTLDGAKMDQKQVLHYIISHLRDWFNDDIPNPPPLRLIISGVAGSGKSVLINTIVTTVRKMFGKTKSVKIVAPTGQAAYNAGGTTCHHGIGVSIEKGIDEGLSGTKMKDMLE